MKHSRLDVERVTKVILISLLLIEDSKEDCCHLRTDCFYIDLSNTGQYKLPFCISSRLFVMKYLMVNIMHALGITVTRNLQGKTCISFPIRF